MSNPNGAAGSPAEFFSDTTRFLLGGQPGSIRMFRQVIVFVIGERPLTRSFPPEMYTSGLISNGHPFFLNYYTENHEQPVETTNHYKFLKYP